jgi:hypothetical protein
MRTRSDMFENFARGYPFGKEEEDWLSSPFGETPVSPHFEEDANTEAVYLAFLEDHDARRFSSNPSRRIVPIKGL